MFRLYADIETQFGKAVLDILRKQFPDQDVDEDPGRVGHKLMNIARRQLQGNDSDAMDAIQEFLTYIATGSRFVKDESGERVERSEGQPWNFAKDWKTWQEALRAIYRNVKTTAISQSQGKMRKKTKERSVDDAFGVRGDGGGAPEGGEARVPTSDETALGKALDDKAAIKGFIDLIDEHIPDLKSSLSEDTVKLFDLIFEDDVGSFSSDIKENMGQATALKEKYPDLFAKNEKRWSGFVGDLRKKLLEEIWTYIENEMSHKDYARLREQFFSDVAPSAVRKKERGKLDEKAAYQRGLDERKLSRLKAKAESGDLTDREKADLERLSKRLNEQGVDVDAISPEAEKKARAGTTIATAIVVASAPVRRPWLRGA